MQDIQLYTTNQIIILVVSVALGSGMYIMTVWQEQPRSMGARLVITTVVMSAGVTHAVYQIAIYYGWGIITNVALLAAAFFATMLIEQLKLKFPKIFDAGFRKVGMDLDPNGTSIPNDGFRNPQHYDHDTENKVQDYEYPQRAIDASGDRRSDDSNGEQLQGQEPTDYR